MKNFQNITKPVMWSTTLVLAAILAGCGGSSSPSPDSAAGSAQKGTVCSGASCVNLGTAGNYAILTKTGVSTVPDSVVTGNIGLSPAAGSLLTAWSETANGAPVTYSTSAQVTGNLYAANYSGGSTSVDLTTAIGDMQTAYTNANLLVPAGGGLVTACPGAGILDGLTITPGVYTCTVDLSIGTNIHLSGAGVYVIRTTKGITQATDTQVLLENGALAQNVFWVPALTVTITGTAGHTTKMAGVILAKTDIVVGTNVTVDGRLLAQTDVTLDQATVTKP